MRVLLSFTGTRGDAQPMLALGEALRAAGHQVGLSGAPNFEGWITDRGFPFHPRGLDMQLFMQEWGGAQLSLAAFKAIQTFSREVYDRSFDLLDQWVPSYDLVVGAGLPVAEPSIAERHGKPYLYVNYCPGMLPAPDHPPPSMPLTHLPRWANRALWWMYRLVSDLPADRLLNRHRRRLGLAKARGFVTHVFHTRPTVIAADPELAPAAGHQPQVIAQPGFFDLPTGEALPQEVASWLDEGAPPVYVGFGSMVQRDAAATTRAAVEAAGRVGCRLILGAGWGGLGDVVALPEGCLAVGSVPHGALFPRLAGSVHHGGAGTTQASALAGIPQWIIPHLKDQYYWARRVERLGLGPAPVLPRRLSAARFEAAFRALTGDQAVKERARALAQRMAARDPLGEAVKILEAYAAGVGLSPRRA